MAPCGYEHDLQCRRHSHGLSLTITKVAKSVTILRSCYDTMTEYSRLQLVQVQLLAVEAIHLYCCSLQSLSLSVSGFFSSLLSHARQLIFLPRWTRCSVQYPYQTRKQSTATIWREPMHPNDVWIWLSRTSYCTTTLHLFKCSLNSLKPCEILCDKYSHFYRSLQTETCIHNYNNVHLLAVSPTCVATAAGCNTTSVPEDFSAKTKSIISIISITYDVLCPVNHEARVYQGKTKCTATI